MAKEEKVEIRRTVKKYLLSHEQYEVVRRRFLRIPQLNLNKPLEYRVFTDRYSLPLTKHLAKVYSIQVKINGVSLRLLVDTGAQVSALFDDVKLALKEEKVEVNVGSVSGQIQQQRFVRAKEVDLKGMMLYNVGFTILKRHNFKVLNMRILRVDGILGWDILSQFDFCLEEKAITFFHNHEAYGEPNMMEASFPTLLATDASGHLAILGFDSGAHRSWIDPGDIKRQNLTVLESGTALTMGVHGMERIDIDIIEKVKFYLENNAILIRKIHTGYTQIFPNFKFHAILGNEIMKGYRLYFVNSKTCIHLEEIK
ncbi:MAG: aspartyl protease family protein [Erysipelotrichaceae bacterium]